MRLEREFLWNFGSRHLKEGNEALNFSQELEGWSFFVISDHFLTLILTRHPVSSTNNQSWKFQTISSKHSKSSQKTIDVINLQRTKAISPIRRRKRRHVKCFITINDKRPLTRWRVREKWEKTRQRWKLIPHCLNLSSYQLCLTSWIFYPHSFIH